MGVKGLRQILQRALGRANQYMGRRARVINTIDCVDVCRSLLAIPWAFDVLASNVDESRPDLGERGAWA
jgi:hypothetical protein